MDPFAFVLVVAAACLHAIWNTAFKKVTRHFGAIWLSLIFGTGIYLTAAFRISNHWSAAAANWEIIFLSGIVHSLYFFLLRKAYKHTSLSSAYPISRGVAVGITTLAAIIFLKESINFQSGIGILAVVGGITSISLRKKYFEKPKGIIYAHIVGASIAAYAIVDKIAVDHVYPLTFISLVYLQMALYLAPYVLIKHREDILYSLGNLKRYIAIIGVGSIGAYLLVLHAFKLERLAYVAATREVSTVIAAALGVLYLRESLNVRKSIGIAAILIGIALIRYS